MIRFAVIALLSLICLLFPVRPDTAWSGQSYQGPVFDAMGQLDETMDLKEVVTQLRSAGVVKFAVFARSRKWLGQMETELLQLRERHPDLMVLGAPKYFKLSHDLDRRYIRTTVEGIAKHGYRFVGEILYSHADKSDGKQTTRGETHVDPSAPGTAELLKRLAPLKVPLMTHWEVYDWQRDWPRFHRLYATHPDQKFIIPHMAFGSPEQVETILSQHPNVYMTISKKFKRTRLFSNSNLAARTGSGFLDKDGQLDPEWRRILIAYSDRLMFATDVIRGHKWSGYTRKVKKMRKLAKWLPAKAADNIFLKTALRVYGVTLD